MNCHCCYDSPMAMTSQLSVLCTCFMNFTITNVIYLAG